MSDTHTRWLTLAVVAAGLAITGCNNRQYENQGDDIPITTPPPVDPEPSDPIEPSPADPGTGMGGGADGMGGMGGMGGMDGGSEIAVGDLMQSPASWIGQTVSGTAKVAEVPTDRGFWMEAGGQRIFAILNDGPEEDPVDINQGQTLQLDKATVRDATYLTSLPGEPLEQQTQDLARSQPVFLVVDQKDVRILDEGAMDPMDPMHTPGTQPGTDPMNPYDPSNPDPTGDDPTGEDPTDEDPTGDDPMGDPPEPLRR